MRTSTAWHPQTTACKARPRDWQQSTSFSVSTCIHRPSRPRQWEFWHGEEALGRVVAGAGEVVGSHRGWVERRGGGARGGSGSCFKPAARRRMPLVARAVAGEISRLPSRKVVDEAMGSVERCAWECVVCVGAVALEFCSRCWEICCGS